MLVCILINIHVNKWFGEFLIKSQAVISRYVCLSQITLKFHSDLTNIMITFELKYLFSQGWENSENISKLSSFRRNCCYFQLVWLSPWEKRHDQFKFHLLNPPYDIYAELVYLVKVTAVQTHGHLDRCIWKLK